MPAGSSGHSGGAAVRVADLNGTAVEGPVSFILGIQGLDSCFSCQL
jgi:hypothetical protein